MSLYDDASLALLTGAGAGKDGKLYVAKPEGELGEELIINGGFDADSDWNKGTGWSIAGGKASCDGTNTASSILQTSQPLTIQNIRVKFSFEISDYKAGTLNATIQGTGGNEFTNISSNGIYAAEATSADAAAFVIFTASAGFIGSIDNVSIKEVIVPAGDFEFNRGSNLAATRVNASGLIEKGRENLLTYSNQFDTTWGGNPANRSILSGYAGYDGSNDAWKLEAISDNNYSVVSQVVSSTGVETFSVYAKAGTSNFFRIQITGGTNTSAAYFDLSGSGSVGTNFNNIYAKIEPVGNGWFRCSVTGNKTTSSTCVILVVDADGSTNVTTGANVYIQDAQLEIGLAATDYIESGATTGKAGLLENEPRFDYSGGASCPALLLEPQRSNIVTQSEYFADVYWSKANVTTELADIASPEGKNNSYKITETTANGQHAINIFSSYRPTLTAGSHTHSCFVKANGVNDIIFYNNGSSGGAGVNINLSNGTYSNLTGTATSASVEPYGNDWFRISLTFTSVAGTSAPSIYLRVLGSYTGDGISGIYMYGMQTEAGSYPTSYIPTYGASATRSRDQADNQSLNPVLGDGNISVMYDFVYDVVGREGSGQIFFLYSDNNSLGIKGTQPTDRRLQLFSYGSFTGTISFNQDVPRQTRHKVVVRVTGEVVELFYNGVKQSETISGAALGGVYNWSRIKLDSTNAFLAGLNQLAVFPEALTDVECIKLTEL